MHTQFTKTYGLFRLVALGILLSILTACSSNSYYSIVPHPPLSVPQGKSANGGPSVALDWEFQRNGKAIPEVTRKWAPHLKTRTGEAGVFSQVSVGGGPADYTLRLTMNNVVDSYAGAIGQGVVSGLTLGLVGSKVTDDYVCTAVLSRNGSDARKEYKYGLTSTSGLIVSGVEGVKAHKRTDDAFGEILDQFLLKSLADFAADGHLR